MNPINIIVTVGLSRARERPRPPALSARLARGGTPHSTPRSLPAVSRTCHPMQSGGRRGSSQSHAVVSHFKQSNTFPMSLEDFQQNLFYLRSGFVFAALAVCYRYKQLCSSAPIPSCISAAIPRSAVQSHIDSMVALSHAVVSHFKQSNTFPMSLEDFQQNLFYLRSGFVSAALAVCYRYAQLCSFVRFGIYSTSYLGSIDATVLLLKAAVFLHLGV